MINGNSYPFMVTYTGKRVYPFGTMKPDDICIEDIAHSLSLLCRYGGHCKRFYSVAEHCVLMASDTNFLGTIRGRLLHDAAEAYIGDLITPLKRKLIDYRESEEHILKCIGEKWNISFSELKGDEIEIADSLMREREMREMMPECPTVIDASPERLHPFYWSPKEAEIQFKHIFRIAVGDC